MRSECSVFVEYALLRHESEIYSLYEIRRKNNERVNSTAAYDKQYLEGRYGADSYLTNMLAEGKWQ